MLAPDVRPALYLLIYAITVAVCNRLVFNLTYFVFAKIKFCILGVPRVKAPVVDHVSVVDYFSEKHEKYGC